jgi:hypothetical protein
LNTAVIRRSGLASAQNPQRLQAIREKSTLGNPSVRELTPVILSRPAVFPVPAFFSLRASAVLVAAAELGLASPPPGEHRVPADALSTSAGEEPAQSDSAPDDNSVVPRVDGHCVPGVEQRDEAHLTDSWVAIEAAYRFPEDWQAELASDDCSVVAVRARGLAQVDSESPVDDRQASLAQVDCSVVVVLVDCWVAVMLDDCWVVVVLVDCWVVVVLVDCWVAVMLDDCSAAVVLVGWVQEPDVHLELVDFPDGRNSALPLFPEALASPSAEPPQGSPDGGSALRFSPMVVQDARPVPAAAS